MVDCIYRTFQPLPLVYGIHCVFTQVSVEFASSHHARGFRSTGDSVALVTCPWIK